ncbi:hypothetical protein [Blastopirellula marina]|uniref:Uncharacterized protein n=1 Tax=Blastopirellula marina TaxID=124 RepID=A0A2S8GKW6_9BACT|nr:hypothetical protein [Blastopirellula marina]PQO45089.1 hypothetical protein C5Y93_16275 [Blastopirellula marina]
MSGFAERLPILVKEQLESLPVIQANASNPATDQDGCSTDMLLLDFRFLGVAEYILQGAVKSFRELLLKSSQLQSRQFARFDQGEPIDESFVTMLAYQSLFDALAADDKEQAKLLASQMGGRPVLEKKYDHPSDRILGYTLRAFVLQDIDQMQAWTPKLLAQSQKKNEAALVGFAHVFEAILADDSDRANLGFQELIEGHKRRSKGRGVFANTPHEVLCLWGIGLARLAQSHGLKVDAIPPLMPLDLIC